MRVRYAFVALPALLIASSVPAFAQSAAGQSNTATTCDDSMVSGQYAVHGAGTIGTAAPFSPEQVVSIRNFDGNGGFKGHGSQAVAGTLHQFTVAGTYKVQSDCTITLSGKTTPSATGAPLHWFGVVTNDGNAIYLIRTDSGVTSSTTLNRVAPFS